MRRLLNGHLNLIERYRSYLIALYFEKSMLKKACLLFRATGELVQLICFAMWLYSLAVMCFAPVETLIEFFGRGGWKE